jgi:hypothetical protein
VRDAVTWLLVWALSPVGTLLNAAMLALVLVLSGAQWNRPLLWAIVAIFVASSAYLDLRAYVARRRNGLSAFEASAAVLDHLWGPRRDDPRAIEEEQ